MKFKLLATAAALALVAAACSSGASTSDEGVASLESTDTTVAVDTAADDTATVSEEEAALAFAQCLRDQGLEVDDPTVDASGNVRPPRMKDILDATEGLTREEIDAARDVCMPLLAGVTFGFEQVDRSEREDQLLEFAQCVRENGYDLPDPDLSKSFGSGGVFGGAIDLEDPAFQEAAAACDYVFGGSGNVPGSGGK